MLNFTMTSKNLRTSKFNNNFRISYIFNKPNHNYYSLARRRAAAKKKLKNLGKSKSTDTEEEEQDEDCGDDGQYHDPTPLHECFYSVI